MTSSKNRKFLTTVTLTSSILTAKLEHWQLKESKDWLQGFLPRIQTRSHLSWAWSRVCAPFPSSSINDRHLNLIQPSLRQTFSRNSKSIRLADRNEIYACSPLRRRRWVRWFRHRCKQCMKRNANDICMLSHVGIRCGIWNAPPAGIFPRCKVWLKYWYESNDEVSITAMPN